LLELGAGDNAGGVNGSALDEPMLATGSPVASMISTMPLMRSAIMYS